VATSTKAAIRAQLLAARRQVSDEVRAAEALSLAAHVVGLAGNGDTVCGYVPVGTEPGSTELLDVLLRAGARVLLPVALTDEDGTPLPLLWADYHPGELIAAPFGLREPSGPRLPAATLAQAGLVLVPALAVDRGGVRLGRGAGFYDRSLPLRAPDARLIAVVRDAEVVDELPAEPHDIRMTAALTPGHGLLGW
jgi:5-formyltetrahydrofolate cyclo-ligase